VTLAGEPKTAASAAATRPGTSPEASPATTATEAAAPEAAASGEASPRRLRHTPELDGIRGLALAVVFVHHLGIVMWLGKPSWFVPGGQVGLDLFFALSGFLITALLLGERERTGSIRAGHFLWRRFLRLTPAVVVFLAGLVAANMVTGRYPDEWMLRTAAWVLPFATNLGLENVVAETGHTWSLSVEAHFYLAWGLVTALVAAKARRPYPVLAALAGIGIVVSAVLRGVAYAGNPDDAFYIYSQTIYRIDAPLLGALAGVAWMAGWLDRVPARLAAWMAPAALAVLTFATFRSNPLSPSLFHGLFTAVAACSALLVIAVQRSGPTRTRAALRFSPLVFLGTISFSVYLWHLPVMMYVWRNATAWPVAQQLLVATVGSLALGAASYYAIERPALRWRARR
jgi:peptidoglycan/LPS O-acetylase OafA/YrhL